MPSTCSPSKRWVYSITAASPRARIGQDLGHALLDCGIGGSRPVQALLEAGFEIGVSGAQQQRGGFHLFPVPGFRPWPGQRHRGSGGSARADLERGRIDGQARNVHDRLDLDEMVGLQRVAGQTRSTIASAMPVSGANSLLLAELDQVDVHALAGEELARDRDILGRNLQARALAHRVGIVRKSA